MAKLNCHFLMIQQRKELQQTSHSQSVM
ncbi:hypothetical protein OESDEN_19588 [Oesophagostomum dentatum]|uniref:Uncharacterized protein n=1 Tax=Oesophagostomum dentatum TaxID=61180 RepID=A0A0B1S5X4_OESDE|nr:hypothetical protein OESDEN_19588 [Oesophagostomum dentatum]